MLPYTAEELDLVIDDIVPGSRDRTKNEPIFVRGRFHEADPGTITVTFDPETDPAQNGLNPTLKANETIIVVDTPILPSSGPQDATVSVSATVNGQPVTSNAVNFRFYEPDPVLDPLGDCSANLVYDSSFENFLGSWVPAASISEYDPFMPEEPAFTGERFLRLGDASFTHAEQDVVIPIGASEIASGIPGTTPATLTFQMMIAGPSPVASDTLTVKFDGTTVYSATGSTLGFDGYATVSVDLTGHADNTAKTLRFESSQSAQTTLFLIDEVAISTGSDCVDSWGIAIEPNLLNFGHVPVGTTKDLSVTVTNMATSPLTGELLLNTPFSLVNTEPEYDIGVGYSETFTIRFAPTVEGYYSDGGLFTGGGDAIVHFQGYTYLPDEMAGGLVIINEVQTNNVSTIVDGDGDRPGWVELYNYSEFAVNLKDWVLRHTPNGVSADPDWAMPDAVIGPEDYLIIFTSGKTGVTNDYGLHAPFTLDTANGGTLELIRRDGTLTHQVASYPGGMLADESWAYDDVGLRNSEPSGELTNLSSGTWHQVPLASAATANARGNWTHSWHLTFQKSSNLIFIHNLDPYVMLSYRVIDQDLLLGWMLEATERLVEDDDGPTLHLDNSVNAEIKTDPGAIFGMPLINDSWDPNMQHLTEPWELKYAFSHMRAKILLLKTRETRLGATEYTTTTDQLGICRNTVHDGAQSSIFNSSFPDFYEHNHAKSLNPSGSDPDLAKSKRGVLLFVQASPNLDYEGILLHEIGHYAGMFGHPDDSSIPKVYPGRVMNAFGFDLYPVPPNRLRTMVFAREIPWFEGAWKFPTFKRSKGFRYSFVGNY